MVSLPFASGAWVYLDTNVFIYLVEATEYANLRDVVEVLFAAADTGEIEVVTSALTLGELLPAPLRVGADDLVRAYRELFTEPSQLEITPVILPIIDAAAVIQSQTKTKLPDALHVASAIASGCTVFATNDKGIRLPDGLPLTIEILSEMSA